MNTPLEIAAIDQLFMAANDHLSEELLHIKDFLSEMSPEALWHGYVTALTARLQSGDCAYETVAATHAAALIRLARQS